MTKVGQLFEEEKIAYAKETAKETARRMLKTNEFTDERIAEFVPSLSINEIHALREETNSTDEK